MFDLTQLERAHEIVGCAVPATPAHAWPLLVEIGLPRAAFFRRLQTEIETATADIVAEGERSRAAAQAP